MRLDDLAVDISPWQADTILPSDWPRLAADPRFKAVILKAGEGLATTETWRGRPWLLPHASAVTATGLDLGLYWYLRLDRSGVAQADAFADLLERCPTTLRAIVDVEEGSGNDVAVARLGAGLVSGTLTAFAERIRERTGLAPILYAGGWMRSLRVGRCGCAAAWIAAYTATLPAAWTAELGFAADELWGWQFAGAGAHGTEAHLAGYPHTTPIGDVDISAIVMADGLARMRWMERHLL